MTSPGPGSDPGKDEITEALLTVAYPAFRFGQMTAGFRRTHWVAVRKNPCEPGVHTVVTDDLDEMQAALGPVAPLPQKPDP